MVSKLLFLINSHHIKLPSRHNIIMTMKQKLIDYCLHVYNIRKKLINQKHDDKVEFEYTFIPIYPKFKPIIYNQKYI